MKYKEKGEKKEAKLVKKGRGRIQKGVEAGEMVGKRTGKEW